MLVFDIFVVVEPTQTVIALFTSELRYREICEASFHAYKLSEQWNSKRPQSCRQKKLSHGVVDVSHRASTASVSALFDWRGNWQPVFSVTISTKM